MNISKPCSGVKPSCTTACTAWIMAAGFSLWKTLRPKSTPAAPEDCHALQKRGYSLIKAFQIATACDLEQTTNYEGRVDYFLFDTKCNSYGGSGKQFDWSVLEAYRGKTPFLLSGGIRPESAGAIRSFRHPRLAGIDLNSGFEIEPGLKDIGKLKEFLKAIQNHNS